MQAGSERVGKTNASGQLLREAQSINLSLHYLEQVTLILADVTGNLIFVYRLSRRFKRVAKDRILLFLIVTLF